MGLDALTLSRIQFAWVIGWHILLPAFTLGIASYIALLEGLHLATGREVYLRVSNFWIRIFAVAFGMGVVTGVVMPFQFGTNWSRLSDTAGNVIGPNDLMIAAIALANNHTLVTNNIAEFSRVRGLALEDWQK